MVVGAALTLVLVGALRAGRAGIGPYVHQQVPEVQLAVGGQIFRFDAAGEDSRVDGRPW